MTGKEGAGRAPLVAITFKRELPVAIERAFRAWTDSRLLSRWLLPAGATLSSAIVDPRTGGRYAMDGRFAEGGVFSIIGTYLIVEAPTKLAMSWVYHGPPGPLCDGASIVTVDFVARRPNLTGITVTHEQATTQSEIDCPRAGFAAHLETMRDAGTSRATPLNDLS